jgi:hypothetical protein|tara:strand:- start:574 stop:879 length:306 start_codon:yes stop_codon:yes gene_type:complete
MNWIGLVFLISSFGTAYLTPPYGMQEKYFFTEHACWDYFEEHPNFTKLKTYDNNFYTGIGSSATIRLYRINRVGRAWITCKEKNEPRSIPPLWNLMHPLPK